MPVNRSGASRNFQKVRAARLRARAHEHSMPLMWINFPKPPLTSIFQNIRHNSEPIS
jgi:hypothetical protein